MPSRMVKVSLSFKTRSAKSCVVVVQIFPTIGNCTSTTGPADRELLDLGGGIAKVRLACKIGAHHRSLHLQESSVDLEKLSGTNRLVT